MTDQSGTRSRTRATDVPATSGAEDELIEAIQGTMLHAGFPDERRKMAKRLAAEGMLRCYFDDLMEHLTKLAGGDAHRAASRASYWLQDERWRDFLTDATLAKETQQTAAQVYEPTEGSSDEQIAEGMGMTPEEWRDWDFRQRLFYAVVYDGMKLGRAAVVYETTVQKVTEAVRSFAAIHDMDPEKALGRAR